MSKEILNFENGRVYVEEFRIQVSRFGHEKVLYSCMHTCGHAYCETTESKTEALECAFEAISKKHYEEVEAREKLKFGDNTPDYTL